METKHKKWGSFTQQSKVKIMFDFDYQKARLPKEIDIKWYMKQMEGWKDSEERVVKPWYFFKTYDYLWEVETTAKAIVSWLTYVLEADDLLFHFLGDETIYIDKRKKT